MRFYSIVLEHIPQYVNLIFTLIDLLTAHVLFLITKKHMVRVYKEQVLNAGNMAEDSKKWLLKGRDFSLPPYFTAAAYLFNPLTILSCVGMATTTFGNFFLALALLAILKGEVFTVFNV